MTHEWYGISFAGSYAAPRFVAAMVTYSGANNSELRYRNLVAGVVEVKVEEDTTWDTGTNHTAEAVAYLAIEGNGLLTAEVSGPGGGSETNYYYFAGDRVAMRKDGTLYFIVGDHLGTTNTVLAEWRDGQARLVDLPTLTVCQGPPVGIPLIPSAVCLLDESGQEVLVGRLAREADMEICLRSFKYHLLQPNPARTVKRLNGRNQVIKIPNRQNRRGAARTG